jgi:hypothetical protein
MKQIEWVTMEHKPCKRRWTLSRDYFKHIELFCPVCNSDKNFEEFKDAE